MDRCEMKSWEMDRYGMNSWESDCCESEDTDEEFEVKYSEINRHETKSSDVIFCEICLFESTATYHCCFSMCKDCYKIYHYITKMGYCSMSISKKTNNLKNFNMMKKSFKEKKSQKREQRFYHRKKKEDKICEMREKMIV